MGLLFLDGCRAAVHGERRPGQSKRFGRGDEFFEAAENVFPPCRLGKQETTMGYNLIRYGVKEKASPRTVCWLQRCSRRSTTPAAIRALPRAGTGEMASSSISSARMARPDRARRLQGFQRRPCGAPLDAACQIAGKDRRQLSYAGRRAGLNARPAYGNGQDEHTAKLTAWPWRRCSARAAAEAAPLLRPHGRLGDRWRGHRAGDTDQGAQAIDGDASVERPEQWLFRIAHNAAQDHLRRRQREQARISETDMTTIEDPSANADAGWPPPPASQLHAACAAQRSAVSWSTCWASACMRPARISGATLAATKAALHRGRAQLRRWLDRTNKRPLKLDAGTSGACAAMSTCSTRATSTPCGR